MRLEPLIHCGTVLSFRVTDKAVYTETGHAAGTRLDTHAHAAPHLAILKQGAYFERIDGVCHLRLPGDSVFYPPMFVHENRFGRLPSVCLNVETQDGADPSLPPSKPPEDLERVVRLIEEGQANSLAPIAQIVGYSPGYLARRFRNVFGMSVGDFVKRTRVRRSARLFFAADLSLAQIALETGYYDQSHCANEVVRVTGFTPSELRRLADAL